MPVCQANRPNLPRCLAAEHEVLVCIEEGSIGGFASQVMHVLAEEGLLESGLKIRPMILPDRFIDHDTPERQYRAAGLDAAAIVTTVLGALGIDRSAAPARA